MQVRYQAAPRPDRIPRTGLTETQRKIPRPVSGVGSYPKDTSWRKGWCLASEYFLDFFQLETNLVDDLLGLA